MSVDAPDPDRAMGAAIAALEEHRRAAAPAVPARQDATGSFRRFLDTTVVGCLWAAGAASPADVGHLLGWSDFDSEDGDR